MATQVQLRRGTSTQNDAFTGAQGELTYDTTNKRVRIHDGGTAGGFEISRADASNLTFPDGSVGSPAISFTSDTNTGIYRGGTDILKFVTAGTDAITIDASQNTTFAGTATMDGLTIDTSADGIVSTFKGNLNYFYIKGSGADTILSTVGSGGNASNLFFQTDPFTSEVNRMQISKDGDISFYEDTGTTAKFFWDASAERLGIGTSSPSEALHVVGDMIITPRDQGIVFNSEFVNIFRDVDSLKLSAYSGIKFFDTNASTERMRIDNNGTLIIGETTTTAVLNGTGVYINGGSTGSFYASATGSQHYFNRQEDGNILSIRRGGVDRGNIGTNSAKLYISSTGNAGLKFRDDLSCIMPCNADGTNSHADQDLGQASVNFRNLYLSGGIRFNGTNTANELDDYEEGGFTPTIGGTATYSRQIGHYTKVGDLCFIHVDIIISTMGTGSVTDLSGLPFTSLDVTGASGHISMSFYQNLNTPSIWVGGYVNNNTDTIYFNGNSSSVQSIGLNRFNVFQNGTRLLFSGVYKVT